MSAPPDHIVLLNAGAGTMGDDAFRAVQEAFAAHGVQVDVRRLAPGEDVAMAARAAVQARPRVIVAGGGDGTLNAVAGAIIGSGVTFGVIPLGTLNHFAKDMHIPSAIDAAVDTICAGRVQRVDVGRVNGRIFLNNSSLGMYPQVVRNREALTQQLGRAKWPAFLWAAWTVLRRHPFVQVRLTVGGKSTSYRSPVVFIGNNSYILDGLEVGARARLDAGHLSIHIVKRTTRWGLVRLALRALIGRLADAEDFETFCAPEVAVSTRRARVHVSIDGEVIWLESPLAYAIEPRALPVLVPVQQS